MTAQPNPLPASVYGAVVSVAWALRRNPQAGVSDIARASGQSRQHVYRALSVLRELVATGQLADPDGAISRPMQDQRKMRVGAKQ